jgi:hypothetical protein
VTDVNNKIEQKDFHGIRLDRHIYLEKNIHQEESLTTSDVTPGPSCRNNSFNKDLELRPGNKDLQNTQLLLR